MCYYCNFSLYNDLKNMTYNKRSTKQVRKNITWREYQWSRQHGQERAPKSPQHFPQSILQQLLDQILHLHHEIQINPVKNIQEVATHSMIYTKRSEKKQTFDSTQKEGTTEFNNYIDCLEEILDMICHSWLWIVWMKMEKNEKK